MTRVKSETQLKKEFVKRYKNLCKKYSLEISAYPQMLKDDRGAWFTVIKYSLSKYEAKKSTKKPAEDKK